MPTFNLTPILHPKSNTSDVYDMLKDLLQIKEKEAALFEGGEINNPASYDALIKGAQDMANDPSLSAAQRREAEKQLRDYQIKQAKTSLDRKKDLDAGDIKQDIEKDLRELEFEFPNNPIAYARGAMMKYYDILNGTSEKESLGQVIQISKSNYVDTTSLEQYQILCQEELSKYSDITDAYETGDFERLSEYAVVYTPHAGKVKAMQIIHRGTADPSYSQKTDLRFTRDEAGNLITTPDTGEQNGMPVYFVKTNVSAGEKYSFGNIQFTYDGSDLGWRTKDTFNLTQLKHAPLHAIPSGNFVKDSADRLFFVNRDRSFFPVNETHKKELNFSEDKVYNLSPDEELNLLPGAIDSSTFPVTERYLREANRDFSSWQAFKQTIGEEIKKPVGLSKMWGGIGKTIGQGFKGFAEATKESWGEGVKQVGKPKETTTTAPNYGLEEAKPTFLIEQSKELLGK